MAKSESKRTVWWVEHPAHTVAVVVAPDWEQATVEAAKWWEVPWRTVAAECCCQQKHVLPKFVCADCGALFYGSDGGRVRCARCECIARDKQLNARAAGKRYWREMRPRAAKEA